MPKGYGYEDFVKYPDSRGFITIGGFDGSYTKCPSNIIHYDEERNIFEYLPAKLDIPRSQFVAALVSYKSDCWWCLIEYFFELVRYKSKYTKVFNHEYFKKHISIEFQLK